MFELLSSDAAFMVEPKKRGEAFARTVEETNFEGIAIRAVEALNPEPGE